MYTLTLFGIGFLEHFAALLPREPPSSQNTPQQATAYPQLEARFHPAPHFLDRPAKPRQIMRDRCTLFYRLDASALPVRVKKGKPTTALTVTERFRTFAVIAMYPTQHRIIGPSNLFGPLRGIGLATGDHVQRQPALSRSSMFRFRRQPQQIGVRLAPFGCIRVNHCCLRLAIRCGLQASGVPG